MTATLRYITWLRDLVDGLGPSNDLLFDAAWTVEFRPYVPNDDNRAADGLALRSEYEDQHSTDLPDFGECRVLEFLIAIARQIEKLTYDNENPGRYVDIFWELIYNLDLNNPDSLEEAISIFEAMRERQYRADGSGRGGLFPLKNPKEDQREIEIWYQIAAYLEENL